LLTLLSVSAGCAPKISIVGHPAADGASAGARDSASAGARDSASFFTPPDASAPWADAAAPPTAELDCKGAATVRGNAGCRFYATQIPLSFENFAGSCFVMFVVNPGTRAASLTLDRGGASLPLAAAARLPHGAGKSLTYAAYDPAVGLPPGEVAILFLSGDPASDIACPAGITPATRETTALFDRPTRQSVAGIGQAFRLTSDRPIVAYKMTPYSGGGVIGVTSATLLLPAESWGLNHIAVGPRASQPAVVLVTAGEDGTEVSFRPTIDLRGGAGVAATPRGATVKIRLDAGQFVQLVSQGEGATGLAGSVVSASKPVSVICGAETVVSNGSFSSAQQQIPTVEALGHEYVAVKHMNRSAREESEPWQLVGVAPGTTLSYAPAPPPGAPTTLGPGEVVEFEARDPFVVRSQDAEHPFHLVGYMTGWKPAAKQDYLGDPEFVNVVATDQYVSAYTFLTDPTYDQTSLVVVRKRGADGRFGDVKLGCSPIPLAGWKPVGDYEFVWVGLVTAGFKPVLPGCDNGGQTMESPAPFAVTVWGWHRGVSYAYPAGASLQRINNVKPPVIE